MLYKYMMKVCFLADFFEQDLRGGAEMCLETIIESCPFKYVKINTKFLNEKTIKDNINNYWIIGNYSLLNTYLFTKLKPKYSVIEFDYKFCIKRQPCIHECNCSQTSHGKYIFDFLNKSDMVWFMSSVQQEIHLKEYSNLNSTVLSTPFRQSEIDIIRQSRERNKPRNGWYALKSNNWQKGYNNALDWGKQNNITINAIENMHYQILLNTLPSIDGLVYLPNGYDTCPRLVTEAKLAGCKLVLNDFTQQKNEMWFNSSTEEIESFLLERPKVFWDKMTEIINGYKSAS